MDFSHLQLSHMSKSSTPLDSQAQNCKGTKKIEMNFMTHTERESVCVCHIQEQELLLIFLKIVL